MSRECVGFEQITVSTAVIGFTAATFGRANTAEITSQDTDDIRYRNDGTDVTVSVGALWSGQAGENFDGALIIYGNLNDVTMVRDASADVAIDVHYYIS